MIQYFKKDDKGILIDSDVFLDIPEKKFLGFYVKNGIAYPENICENEIEGEIALDVPDNITITNSHTKNLYEHFDSYKKLISLI